MVFGGIQAAGTKQNGKQRQQQGYHQRGILSALGVASGQRCARSGKQVESEHDAFELQGDVGQHGDQTQGGDNHPQALGLAITGGNEIGDGGDVFLFADGKHPGNQAPAHCEQDNGADIDRQEVPDLAGGHAHCTEEGPAGTPDGNRQAIDPDAQAWAELTGLPVAPEGDGKQASHIDQECGRNQPTGKHHGWNHLVSRRHILAASTGFAQQQRLIPKSEQSAGVT